MRRRSFHVRSSIPESERKAGERKAVSLEENIYSKFLSKKDAWFCEYDFDGMALTTSVRRALCNLKKKGLIRACKPSEKILGKYGVHIFVYKYKPQTGTQIEAAFHD